MRLIRIGDAGYERPAAMVSATSYVDLTDVVDDYSGDFFASGELEGLPQVIATKSEREQTLQLGGQRIGPPIARPHQILCVGLNYRDHAKETGQPAPLEPIVFNKAPNTLVGPFDDVLIPRGSSRTDWEVELGIVVGRRAYLLDDLAEASSHIAGFVVVNDVSEREWQLERGGQWVKGKSAPTFNPTGPYLVTRDEVGDVTQLDLWLEVDGVRKQEGSTSDMLFDPSFLVHYLSQFMALEAGDLINSGTPAGIGMARQPPQYLNGGEVVTLGITRLGSQRQHVVRWEA